MPLCEYTFVFFFVFRATPSTEYTTAEEGAAAQDKGTTKEEGASKDIVQYVPLNIFLLTDNCSQLKSSFCILILFHIYFQGNSGERTKTEETIQTRLGEYTCKRRTKCNTCKNFRYHIVLHRTLSVHILYSFFIMF